MRPSNSAPALKRFYRDRSIDPASASLAAFIEGALDFYASVPASGLAADSQADMLLFQFGIFDWGSGEHFEIDLTRQFIVAGKVDDEAISQLRCTVYFDPTSTLKAVGSDHRWCEGYADLPEFKASVLSSQAYIKALAEVPKRREIAWSPV
ncbi:MAG TPA: hypothetical protein VHB47_24980 [Thermoanaerobaculia bacterium]|jgi:hypothetical protein|nr:hypothetical protein [Thermoanaerobaculia bacterium]